jgi:hypothetical protein
LPIALELSCFEQQFQICNLIRLEQHCIIVLQPFLLDLVLRQGEETPDLLLCAGFPARILFFVGQVQGELLLYLFANGLLIPDDELYGLGDDLVPLHKAPKLAVNVGFQFLELSYEERRVLEVLPLPLLYYPPHYLRLFLFTLIQLVKQTLQVLILLLQLRTVPCLLL